MEKVVRFEAEGNPVAEVKGRLTNVVIRDIGEIVEIFFTRQHARYWLSQASPFGDATVAANAPSDGQRADDLDRTA